MSEPWLSNEELKDLTGYVQPSRQSRWLQENRIKHFVNRLNRVRVPRDAIGGLKVATEKRTEPDFSKVKKNN